MIVDRYFDGIPELMVPMLWFKQEVILPEDLAGDAKVINSNNWNLLFLNI